MDSLLSTEVLDTYDAFVSEYSIYERREETVHTDSSEAERKLFTLTQARMKSRLLNMNLFIACVKL